MLYKRDASIGTYARVEIYDGNNSMSFQRRALFYGFATIQLHGENVHLPVQTGPDTGNVPIYVLALASAVCSAKKRRRRTMNDASPGRPV